MELLVLIMVTLSPVNPDVVTSTSQLVNEYNCQKFGEEWNELNSAEPFSPEYRYVCLGAE